MQGRCSDHERWRIERDRTWDIMAALSLAVGLQHAVLQKKAYFGFNQRWHEP